MKIHFINVLKDLFQNQSTDDFRTFYAKSKGKTRYFHQSQLNNTGQLYQHEASISNTNEKRLNKIVEQHQDEQENMETTFKSLTGSEILKIYADAQFFGDLTSNKQQYPRQLDQILWRITYLIGQVLMDIQNNLIERGYLQTSIILSVKQIKEAAFNIVQLQLAPKDKNQASLLQQVKWQIIRIFQEGDYEDQAAIKVYNFAIKLWKRPLQFDLDIQPKPAKLEKLVQTDPIATQQHSYTPTVTSIPKPSPSLDFNRSKQIETSQVKVFNPKQFKNPLQTPKQPRNTKEKAVKPLPTATNKPPPRISKDMDDIYDAQSIRSVNPSIYHDDYQQSIILSNNKKPQKSKPISKGKAIKQRLDAVKGKMALLNKNNSTNKIPDILQTNPQQPFSPFIQQIGNSLQNQPEPNSNKVMDLCNQDDKIPLDQNKNRIIKQQLNGFRPPIFQENKATLNQTNKGNLMLNPKANKITIPPNIDRNVNKQYNSNFLNNFNLKGNPGLARQNNSLPQKTQELRPKIISDQQIINLNQKTAGIGSAKKSNQVEPSQLKKAQTVYYKQFVELGKGKVKLQQKLEDSAHTNERINLTNQMVSKPASIQPLTIPVIGTSSNKTDKTGNSFDPRQQFRKKMREKWTPEQQNILVQNYMEKGDETECSKILQQKYGQHPKWSSAGVKLRVDWIVRKVYEKFNSLTTKNENIIKFKANWEFISKKSGPAVRRKIYREIVAIYTAMLNMSEQKRQVISKKIMEINHICQIQIANSK